MSTAMVMVFAAACSSKNTPPATASETTATVAETTQQETPASYEVKPRTTVEDATKKAEEIRRSLSSHYPALFSR